jgi:hypothetical protein
MTLTGHWNRIDKRTAELWPRNILEQEKQRWHERWELYCDKIEAYVASGGSVNQKRARTFAFISGKSVATIQDKMNMIDALRGKTPINHAKY